MAETNMTTSITLGVDRAAEYFADAILELPERTLAFYDLCKKERLPQKMGTMIKFVRSERLALPAHPANEGVTPTADRISMSEVTAVCDQWIGVTSFTDRAELTLKHPIVQTAKNLQSKQHNELIDREIQVVAGAGTNVFFPGTVGQRSSLVFSDVITSATIKKRVAALRQTGAPTARTTFYNGVMDPFIEADLITDGVYQAAAQYSAIKTLREFDVGPWLGVWWMRSNFLPILTQMTASWTTHAAVTGGSMPSGSTAFDAGIIVTVTRLNDQTRFEDVIDDTTVVATTGGAAKITIAATATTGLYRIYSTMDGAITGGTLQGTVSHTTGTASDVYLIKAGTSGPNVWVVTGVGPVAPPTAPATITVHTTYIFGDDCLACVQLDGAGLETFLTPKAANQADPAAQRRYASWKRMFKAVILNPDFYARIESASAFN